MIEASAPVKNATYSAATDRGKPKNKPIKKANFTSPNPIPRPCVSRKIKKKNKKQISADIRWLGSWTVRKMDW
jgi:hypothetical protein